MLLAPEQTRQQYLLDVVIVDRQLAEYERWATATELRVVLCESAEAALRLPVSRSWLWLIHTDLPDMSGLELYRQLALRRGRNAALLISEHYDAEREREVLATGGLHFLCKPFEHSLLDEMCATLRAKQRPVLPSANEKSASPLFGKSPGLHIPSFSSPVLRAR